MKNGAREIGDARPATRLPVNLATLGFQAALDMIPQPTFVIDRNGRTVHANLLGDQLLRREHDRICRSLLQAASGQSPDRTWRLTPLERAGLTPGFIAVLEARSPDAAPAARRPRVGACWKLTARQTQVLDLVAGGATNAAIAATLGIKKRTVEFHLSAIFDRVGVDNRATLIARSLTP